MSKKRERELQRENESILFENQKVVDVNMEHEVKKSFIEYSMSVIISRALPDVRDGMKPGQRRVLYTMYEDHLTHDKPFRKSATTVGAGALVGAILATVLLSIPGFVRVLRR